MNRKILVFKVFASQCNVRGDLDKMEKINQFELFKLITIKCLQLVTKMVVHKKTEETVNIITMNASDEWMPSASETRVIAQIK